jgi:hypothetical protein
MHIRVKNVAIVLASKDNKKYCFLTEKGDAIVPPLLCMNQEYISAVKSERLPFFWVYIDNIYGLRLKGQTNILSQN